MGRPSFYNTWLAPSEPDVGSAGASRDPLISSPAVRYLLGRIGQALLVLWATFTAAFILLQVLPGDAILIKFQNPELGLSPDQIAEIRASYGADSPLWSQYLHTLGNFLTGDFGYSVQAGVPVGRALLANLPPTVWLAGFGFAAGGAAGGGDRRPVQPRRLRLAALGDPVAAVAVRLGAGVLARHHADPDLLLPAEADPGDQPRPVARG